MLSLISNQIQPLALESMQFGVTERVAFYTDLKMNTREKTLMPLFFGTGYGKTRDQLR